MASTRSSTVVIEDIAPTGTSCATWQAGPDRSSPGRLPRIANTAGVIFVLFGSAMTGLADPWQADERRRSAVVSSSNWNPRTGRRMTLGEARLLAIAVLRRAEAERLDLTRSEAAMQMRLEADA